MSEHPLTPQKPEKARYPASAREGDIQDDTEEAVTASAPPLSPGARPECLENEAVSPCDDLAALRRLLFSPEMAELERLRQRLDNPASRARDVGDILAEALLIRARKDGKLATALEPVVESILSAALRKHPREFVSALFPLMGPTIRRSIVETFRSMLESLNKSLEMSFSWKGLRWRVEALRTGKPFAEVVLLHTLLYRVEQVFFIHNKTGLVLAHAVNEDVEAQDAEMVSAMLTAIQDFTRDCFSGGGDSHLDSLRFDPFTIFVEPGEEAYLACVMRGTPPEGFRETLRDSFELMLVECADALHDFNGDTTPFHAADRYLQDVLVSRSVNEGKPLSPGIKALPVLLLLALAAGIGTYWYHARIEQKALTERKTLLDSALALLGKEPGIVVLHLSESPSGGTEIVCLRDELARPYSEILQDGGLEASGYRIRSIPQISYDHEIIAKRVAERITPPPSVSCTLTPDDTLHISGSAPIAWILHIRNEALAIPGVKKLDLQKLADPRMDTLQALINEVENARIAFPLGKDVPTPETQEALARAVDALVRLEKMAKDMHMSVSLAVYGFTDMLGTEKRNYELSQERAKTLAAMLYARGSSMPVAVYGMGADTQKQYGGDTGGNPASRRIELRVRTNVSMPETPEGLEQ